MLDRRVPPSLRQVQQLVTGARRHLEAGHATYMMDVVRKHAQVARLGGETCNLARVHAFLRVSLKGQGQLDFDAPGACL